MSQNYREAAEALFDKLASFFDDLSYRAPDLDADWQEDNIFRIAFENGNEILISRHDSSEEIWIASPSGAFHFRWENEVWVDLRLQRSFSQVLAQCLQKAGNLNLTLTF